MAIMLIMFFWILEGKYRQKFQQIRNDRFRQWTLLFALYYVIYLVGLLYSSNQFSALLNLQTKLSLLIFPLIFSTIDLDLIKSLRKRIIQFYILGCLFSSAILLLHSLILFYSNRSINTFFYGELSWYHHASYLSMFLVFAIGILLYRLYTSEEKIVRQQRILSISAIIYFSIIVVLLSSKAGLISLLLILLFHVGYLFFNKRIVSGSILLVSYILVAWAVTTQFDVTSDRITDAQRAISSNTLDKNSRESTTSRLLIWESAMSIIKQNVLFGVGTGDANDVLLQTYKSRDYSGILESRLNAHNQYLQTFIAVGIPGFLVLLIMLSVPLIQSLRTKNILYFLLLVLVSFNLLFESMFERQAGVVFYAFFNGLFFCYMMNEKEEL